MANSIYDILPYEAGVEYDKNRIVMVTKPFDQTGLSVPKSIKYYYALKKSTGSNPESDNQPDYSSSNWGGYKNINGEAVPQFLWTPSYNLSVNHSPRVNSVVFGNGYEQRAPDGIYTGLIKMEMTFEMRSDAEAKAILHFLRARKGASSFIIKNLPEIYGDSGYKKRFTCPSFNSTFAFYNNHTIKASFSETNN